MKKKTYKNGAILLYKRKKINCTTVTVSFIFGENRDNYSESTAHFCEHMLYKETKKHNEKELSKLIEETFSRQNAHTSLFHIFMDFVRSNKVLIPCFELSSEMLLSPKFTEKGVKNEKGVIIQELLSILDNNKNSFYSATQRTLHDKYNKNTNIIGTKEEIENLNIKDLQKFHDEVFISQNFIISIVGKISYRKARRLAEKYYISKLKSNEDYPVDKSIYKPIQKQGNLNIEHKQLNKAMCKITFKIDKEYEGIISKSCLNLMSRALNNINIDIYNGKLRNNGLTYTSWFDYSTLKDKYTASFYFESSKENINKIINIISNVIKDLKTKGIEQDILENIKKQINYNEDEAGIITYPSASVLLENYLYTGNELFSKNYEKTYKKTLFKMKTENIKNLCEKIFSDENNIYVTIFGDVNENDIYSYAKIQKILTK